MQILRLFGHLFTLHKVRN